MAKPRISRGPVHIMPAAITRLIEAGCESHRLSASIHIIQLLERDAFPGVPTTSVRLINGTPKKAHGVLKRARALASEIKGLVTPEGKRFISGMGFSSLLQTDMHITNYEQVMQLVLRHGAGRTPPNLTRMRSDLVDYVLSTTGRPHDREIAELFNMTTGAWRKWRKTHYVQPSRQPQD